VRDVLDEDGGVEVEGIESDSWERCRGAVNVAGATFCRRQWGIEKHRYFQTTKQC